jgi:hypothetical protein
MTRTFPVCAVRQKTFEELADVVFALAPDLLLANAVIAPERPTDITIRLVGEREKTAHVAA